MRHLGDYVFVALGAALGSVLRSALEWSAHGLVPSLLAVFGINLVGAFLVGLLSAFLLERFVAPEGLRLFLTVGVLGGFTTFGTLAYEAVQLAQAGHAVVGGLVLLGEIALGVLAAGFGQGVARRAFSGSL